MQQCSETAGTRWRSAALAAALALLISGAAAAQELEPRRYANTPVGMNFLGFGYLHARGNLLLDPAVAIDDVDANVHIFVLRYVRSLALFGKNARLSVGVPTTLGDWQAVVEDELLRREIVGVGDVAVALDYNFVGAPALKASEFGSYDKKTVVGATLQVRIPVGQYDRERALNLGTNRWTFVPQVGASRVLGRWTVEAIAKLWLFTANNDFWDGNRLEQRPLASFQVHGIYTVRPGFWIAAGVGLANGGRSFINGEKRDTLQRNSRFGVVVAYPLSARQGVALTFGRSITTSSGTSSSNVGISYQLAWGGTR
jgi:hypothetical protein